jgi:hypothetical protein
LEHKGYEIDVFVDDRPSKTKRPFASRTDAYCSRWRKSGETEWRSTLMGYRTDAAAASAAIIAIDAFIAKQN